MVASEGISRSASPAPTRSEFVRNWNFPTCAPSSKEIPSTLLHPIFGEFIDDCDHHETTETDNALALSLSVEMTGYLSKEIRVATFQDVLQRHGIHMSSTTIDNTAFTTDGDMQLNGYRYVILEVKNEKGSVSSQAFSYYTHSIIPFTRDNHTFRFPCLLITLFGKFCVLCRYLPLLTTTYTGAHITFSAAVWSSPPNVQTLLTTLPLFWHHTDTTMRTKAARGFGALRNAISSLERCYKEMSSGTMDSTPRGKFPYPYSYTRLGQSSRHEFEYIAQINKACLLFSAKTTDDQMICVKFARRYSKVVHQFCADNGFAPKLRGFEYLPGGWHMVVMEMISQEYRCLGRRPTARYTHFEDVRAKLSLLHQEGYVHGDLRDTNIMVKANGDQGFKLVDFDWSGIVDEVRYPMNVNRESLWRPDGADDGQLIKTEHDIAMLEDMIQNRSG